MITKQSLKDYAAGEHQASKTLCISLVEDMILLPFKLRQVHTKRLNSLNFQIEHYPQAYDELIGEDQREELLRRIMVELAGRDDSPNQRRMLESARNRRLLWESSMLVNTLKPQLERWRT